MDEKMLPVGLEENQFFKVTTSSVPLYQTKNIGLTQYTPNRVTSYLGNYNEDMRRIDKFSVSIGAYVEKVIDEGGKAHEALNQKIINNTSMIAFAEQRIDTLEESITELQTDIGNVRVEVDEKISESENKIIEEIGKLEAATSSVTTYLEQEIKDVDTKHTLGHNELSQRLHVAEDEIKDLTQREDTQTTQISNLQTSTTALETKTDVMQTDIDNNMGDIASLQDDMITAKSDILTLKNTDTVQNSSIATLREHVAEMQTIGDKLNALKATAPKYFLNGVVSKVVVGESHKDTYTLRLENGARPGTLKYSEITLSTSDSQHPSYSVFINTRGDSATNRSRDIIETLTLKLNLGRLSASQIIRVILDPGTIIGRLNLIDGTMAAMPGGPPINIYVDGIPCEVAVTSSTNNATARVYVSNYTIEFTANSSPVITQNINWCGIVGN